MSKINKVSQHQPREVAREVMAELDRRERLKKASKSVYDGDLSWKKVTSENEHHSIAKYQSNQPTLSSLIGNHSKKLDII